VLNSKSGADRADTNPTTADSPILTKSVETPAFYRPELDVLRFLAFVLVFIHHSFPKNAALYAHNGLPIWLSQLVTSFILAGGYGVDLFFCLSAYLITELFVREVDLRGTVNIKAFYVRRALRLWPLYFVFLFLAYFVVGRVIQDDSLPLKYFTAFLLFVGNWAVALWGYPPSVAAPLWSVSIEEQFYLLWPVVIVLLGVRRLRAIAFSMLALATASRLALAVLGVAHPGVWANTFARLDPFALGALLSVMLRGGVPRLSGFVRVALGALGLGAITAVAALKDAYSGYAALLTYPIVALSVASITGAMLGSKLKTLQHPVLVYLGRISYGLYVFHVLAIRVLDVALPGGGVRTLIRIGGAFLSTVLMAAISYQALEKPFLRLKQRFTYVRSREA
jgi:peptidoglycan/LPS O-acetylase OafA/YrhL